MDETAGTNSEFTKEATQDEVIRDYEKLVYFVAHKFKRYGLPFDDMVQIGFIALLRARDTFDQTKGVAFVSHAAACIKYAILKDMGNHSRTIRVPFSSQRLLAKIRNAREQLVGKLEREPTNLEISNFLHIPEKTVRKIKLAKVETLSIHAPRGEDGGGDFQDVVPSDALTPEQILADQDTFEQMERLVVGLPARERMVIQQRYSRNPVTLEQIGALIGKTYQRAGQIEAEALKRLKSLMRDELPTDRY
jgi:RNA polymerase sigma factor (sigma-70 family)